MDILFTYDSNINHRRKEIPSYVFFPCKAQYHQIQINHQRRHPSVLFEHALMFYYNTKPLSSQIKKKSSALNELKWRSRLQGLLFNFILFCARGSQGSALSLYIWVVLSALYNYIHLRLCRAILKSDANRYESKQSEYQKIHCTNISTRYSVQL